MKQPEENTIEQSRSLPKEVRFGDGTTELLSSLRREIDEIGDEDEDDLLALESEIEEYAKAEDGRAFIITDAAGKPLGYIEVNLTEPFPKGVSEDLAKSDKFKNFAHISRIGVLDGNRRGGVGSDLMARAEDFARKSGKSGVWLDYLSDNKEAAAFYPKKGYKNEEEFKGRKGKNCWFASKTF